MTSLYQLTYEMESLLEKDEVTETELQETFGAIEKKAESVCQYLTVLSGQIDMFKVEEKRLSERRKTLENQQGRIREYIKQGMATIGVDKLKAGTFAISVSPSAGKLFIENSALIPAKYLTVVPQTTLPNNAEIKKAIAAGETIPGIYIEPGTTLKIR